MTVPLLRRRGLPMAKAAAMGNPLSLPVALAGLSREHVMDYELMMAGSVVTILPVLLLFLVLQRYYIQGLLLGSVKG